MLAVQLDGVGISHPPPFRHLEHTVGACPARGSAFISQPRPTRNPQASIRSALGIASAPQRQCFGFGRCHGKPPALPKSRKQEGELPHSQTNRYFLSTPSCQRGLPLWEFKGELHPCHPPSTYPEFSGELWHHPTELLVLIEVPTWPSHEPWEAGKVNTEVWLAWMRMDWRVDLNAKGDKGI